MNIYARYFDQDILAHDIDELLSFLASIPEITVDQRLTDDIRAYVGSDMPYPKRYKIRPRVYFILIKTTAESLEEFKAHRKAEVPAQATAEKTNRTGEGVMSKKEIRTVQLSAPHDGWYLGTIIFKRVIQISTTQKFRYQDTTFQAYVRAASGQDCYNRLVDHLKGRPEVDQRSQFPSPRGANFTFQYMGETLPEGVA